jgi:hypothetical protein
VLHGSGALALGRCCARTPPSAWRDGGSVRRGPAGNASRAAESVARRFIRRSAGAIRRSEPTLRRLISCVVVRADRIHTRPMRSTTRPPWTRAGPPPALETHLAAHEGRLRPGRKRCARRGGCSRSAFRVRRRFPRRQHREEKPSFTGPITADSGGVSTSGSASWQPPAPSNVHANRLSVSRKERCSKAKPKVAVLPGPPRAVNIRQSP